MISTWYRLGDRVLSACERFGFPPVAVTVIAYLIGFEIAAFFSRSRINPLD